MERPFEAWVDLVLVLLCAGFLCGTWQFGEPAHVAEKVAPRAQPVVSWPLVDLSSTSKKKQWSPPNLDGGVHEINPGHKEDRFTLQPGQWAKLHATGGMKYEIDAPDNFGYRLRLEDGTELKGGSRWDSSAHPTFYVEGARENQRFVFRETKK